jgi:hypothetical protein
VPELELELRQFGGPREGTNDINRLHKTLMTPTGISQQQACHGCAKRAHKGLIKGFLFLIFFFEEKRSVEYQLKG